MCSQGGSCALRFGDQSLKIREIILPALYDPLVLTEEERSRFLAALGDGFGARFYEGPVVEVALPAKVDAGLLTHSVFFGNDEKTDKFWAEIDETGEAGHFKSTLATASHWVARKLPCGLAIWSRNLVRRAVVPRSSKKKREAQNKNRTVRISRIIPSPRCNAFEPFVSFD
jgi:hypothetical protein